MEQYVCMYSLHMIHVKAYIFTERYGVEAGEQLWHSQGQMWYGCIYVHTFVYVCTIMQQRWHPARRSTLLCLNACSNVFDPPGSDFVYYSAALRRRKAVINELTSWRVEPFVFPHILSIGRDRAI